jgi:large subunit ribosomal protein L25
MSEFVLEANSREVSQHSKITQLRDGDRVPAVVYGPKNDTLAIEIEYNPLYKVAKEAGLSNIITLKLDKKEIPVIIREYQKHSVSDRITHVDFLALDDKHRIVTEVPLEFVGVSSAVREQGGKLNIKNEKVRVDCFPKDLPNKIEVDLGILSELGQKLMISDLKVNSGVKILNNPNDPVVDVNIPKKARVEESTAAVAAPVAGEAAKDASAESAENSSENKKE